MSRSATRGRLAQQATGLIVGMFIAGLMVPFAVDRKTETVVGGANAGPGGATANAAIGQQPGAAGATASTVGVAGSADGTVSGAAPGTATGTPTADGSVGAGDPAAAEVPTSSDVGISETEIRIGVMIIGLGAFGAVGTATGLDEDSQRAAWNAAFAAENAAGGFAGRTLVPVFRTADFTDATRDSARAACVAMGEDLNVFAVIGIAYTGDPVTCLTQRYGLPFFTRDQMPEEYFRDSNGLLISVVPSWVRGMRNMVWQAHELGLLEGRTIGVLATPDPAYATGVAQIAPALAEYGYEVAHQSQAEGANQMAVEVQQMKNAGVDVVIAATFPGVWFDEAQRQGWNAQYLFWEASAGCSDHVQRRDEGGPGGRSLDGAVAVCSINTGDRSIGVPPNNQEVACHAAAQAAGRNFAPGSVQYLLDMETCSLVHLVAEGLRAAGVNPTRPVLAGVIPSLQGIEIPNMPPGNGFPPGRTDYGTRVRANQFDLSCPCFRPLGDWVPARF